MQEKLLQFLRQVFGDGVTISLAYSDKVTRPGLSVIFEEGGVTTEKELDGTTNNITYEYRVFIWDDSMEKVLEQSTKLFKAMEGTEFQVQSMRAIRADGRKRKWHREMTVSVMEEVWNAGDYI